MSDAHYWLSVGRDYGFRSDSEPLVADLEMGGLVVSTDKDRLYLLNGVLHVERHESGSGPCGCCAAACGYPQHRQLEALAHELVSAVKANETDAIESLCSQILELV